MKRGMPARQLQDYDAAHDFAEKNQTAKRTGVSNRFRRMPKKPIFRTVLNTTLRAHLYILFLVGTVLCMLTIISNGLNASRGYDLVKVQQEADELEQENARISVEIAQLKNPERIKRIAEKELKMQVPKKTYFAHENQ